MKKWRKQALKQVPSLTRIFRRERDPMGLWITLQLTLCELCSRPRPSSWKDAKAKRQVYRYARWCYFQSGDPDVIAAVACAFYEHLPLDEDVRRDVANHLPETDFEALEKVFRYHLDTDAAYERFRGEFLQAKSELRQRAMPQELSEAGLPSI